MSTTLFLIIATTAIGVISGAIVYFVDKRRQALRGAEEEKD